VAVRPTGDVRGNGAYAAAPIPKGSWLGDYTGDALDRAAFFARYPDGVVRGLAGPGSACRAGWSAVGAAAAGPAGAGLHA
jgi:hypothetical protein